MWIHIQFLETTKLNLFKVKMKCNRYFKIPSEQCFSIGMLNQEPETQLLVSLQLSLCSLVQSASEFQVIC